MDSRLCVALVNAITAITQHWNRLLVVLGFWFWLSRFLDLDALVPRLGVREMIKKNLARA